MKQENKYNCSQADLYAVATNSWAACLADITGFAAFNSKYTPAFVQVQLDAVRAAQQLKSKTSLDAETNKVRVQFDKSSAICRANTQLLKQYIILTFGKDLQPANFDDAGLGYYQKAATGNWSALSNMLTLGTDYLTANLAALIAAEMPAAFATGFTAAASECFSLFKQLVQLTSSKTTGASSKVQANNLVYVALTEMQGNGQRIFVGSPQRHNYVFSTALRVVRGSGVAGLSGIVTSQLTSHPLANAIVSVPDTAYTATTDSKGRFRIRQMLAGTYSVRVQAFGFAPVDKIVNLKPGVTSRTSFPLDEVEKAMQVA